MEALNMSAAAGEEILDEFPEDRRTQQHYTTSSPWQRTTPNKFDPKNSSDIMEPDDESPLIFGKKKI